MTPSPAAATDPGGPLPSARWVLPAGLALCFFLGLGSLPLFDLDEGAFAEATREMLASGDFITTYLNGEPRFDKPILIYWLQALAVAVIGVDEWAFRLPSALAACAWMVAVYRFGREFLDETTGLLAALVGMTSAAVVVIGRAATADALLNLWLAVTLLTMYRYHQRPDRRLVLLTYLFMGLGFLTKGPVAVAIPGAVSLLFFASTGHWRAWLRAVLTPPGWLVFLAVAGPWYVMEYLDQGQAFIDGFFLKHNVGRFSDTMESHGGTLYYYLLATPLVVLPWTGLLLAVVPTLRRVLADPLDRFLWIWFGLVFLLFSLSGTQLPHYILYGATPLFLLMARHRARLRSRWLAFAGADVPGGGAALAAAGRGAGGARRLRAGHAEPGRRRLRPPLPRHCLAGPGNGAGACPVAPAAALAGPGAGGAGAGHRPPCQPGGGLRRTSAGSGEAGRGAGPDPGRAHRVVPHPHAQLQRLPGRDHAPRHPGPGADRLHPGGPARRPAPP